MDPIDRYAGVVEVDYEAPSSPSNLVALNPSSSTMDLSWTASTDNVGVSGYFIYYSDGTLATTAPSNSITVNGLNPSTSYTFYVTAYDAAMNESGQSNNATQVTTGIPDTEVPTAPTNLVASNITTSTIDLNWNASTDNIGVVGYYVYQDGVQVSDVTSGTSTTVSGLTESTQYSFYVRAYDAAGNLSEPSNTVTPSTTGGCVHTTFCEHDFNNNNFGCWNGDNGASISGRSNKYVKLEGDNDENIFSAAYDLTGFTRVNISFSAETNSKWDSSDEYLLEVKIGSGDYEQLYSWGETSNSTTRSYNITQVQYLTENITVRIINKANRSDEDVYIDDASIIGYCN
ncbi:fibronectin type III domain-containing protein [Flavobacteriaceae bacterium]|nr:fibronectin type III domain-containing protein [Flavobacteriaceae bacterium]